MTFHHHPNLQPILKATICLSLVLVLLTPMIASAQQSWDDINSIIGETPFYDPNACTSGNTNNTVGSVSVTPGQTSDNEKTIWNWLVGQGLTGAQAAGIMGNIQQESDFDPTIVQGGGNSNNPAAAGGGGWGLVQWTPGAKVLLDVAGAHATGPITAIATQLQIAWWEAQGNGQWAGQGNTIAKVAAITGNTPAAAAQVASIWVNDFEHAGIIGPRGQYADQILATAKQQNWPNANATTPSGNLNQGTGSTNGSTAGSQAGTTCCPTTPATNTSAGSFESLTGNDAISGTFVLGFDAGTPKSTIEAVFKKYKPAGMYILGTTDAAAAGFNQGFYQALALDAGHPIIAASDEEGLYTRYKYSFNFPSAGQMSTMSDAQVQSIGQQVGKAMNSNGLNMDLAPVLDVGTGNNSDFHQQPGRTFGTNPTTVTAKAGAFAAGLQGGGIKPVYKHFPGLGTSNGNTDSSSVTSPNLKSLEGWDLKPYQSLVSQNDASVMMDNAHVPGLTAPGEVASTSPAAVSLLRNNYNFTGLILSDDLIASGVGQPPATALAKALEAGVDAPLEKYQSDATLDAAIAQAQAAHVNTQSALALLDSYVPTNTPNSSNPSNGNSNCSNATTSTSTGNIVDPFPGGWIPNRLDMGYDGTFKGQIVSPFDGTVQYSGGTNGWSGSYMVVVKANGNVGLPNSQSLYFTEGVKPIVSNGTKVTAGTPIADAYPSPYGDAYATTPNGAGQIEWGVADANTPTGTQPNTEAVVLGIVGNCLPTTYSRNMDLAFYSWAKNTAKVPGTATNQTCAGAP